MARRRLAVCTLATLAALTRTCAWLPCGQCGLGDKAATVSSDSLAPPPHTASRRALAALSGVALMGSMGSKPAPAYREPGWWLKERKKDPLAEERWGVGGTMRREEVEQAAANLTDLQRYVLLEGGVEDDTDGRRFVNGYEWDNTEEGVYVSAISGVPLFSSSKKMTDPKLGWPGFTAPIDPKRLVLRPDPRDGISREVLDAASRTHLGHIVDDGGDQTHYCINAASLRFVPKARGNR